VCCSVLQCVAVCCSVLQCIAARVHTCAYSFVSHRVHSLSSSPPLGLPPSLILMHSHCPSPLVCDYLLPLNRTATLDRAYIYCNTLQHTATHCNTLQLTATYCSTLQHTAVHCNTLQHTGDCSTLQHTATHCHFMFKCDVNIKGLLCLVLCPFDVNTLQQTTTYCNTLQQIATHCQTLQHTATHCHVMSPLDV